MVAKGYSFLGRSYLFRESEDGEETTYEVGIKLGLLTAHYEVKRNGLVVFAP